MVTRHDPETRKQFTELAEDLKIVIDIMLKRYDRALFEDLGLVMRLDGEQIILDQKEQYPTKRENEGGLLRIDYMEKIVVKKRRQQIKGEHGMIIDLHKRIS